MRISMRKHGVTGAELIERIHAMGGDRARSAKAVTRFVDGGPGCIAVYVAIIDFVVQRQQMEVH